MTYQLFTKSWCKKGALSGSPQSAMFPEILRWFHLLSHLIFPQDKRNYSHFLFFFFLGPQPGHMEVPRLGVQLELWPRPTPQPQQWGIWVTSATYTTTHGNARSLIHWVRPGIKPAISWMLVRFIPAEAQWELLLGLNFSFSLNKYPD